MSKQIIKKCKKCGEPETKVDLEELPCCGNYICWDWCLYDIATGEPVECPLCGRDIRVEPKDPMTKEAYVELINNKEKMLNTKKGREYEPGL